MLITFKDKASIKTVGLVIKEIENSGFKAKVIKKKTALLILGETKEFSC